MRISRRRIIQGSFSAFGAISNSQAAQVRPFMGRLKPAGRDAGFRLEEFWVWCGSAIRGEDGGYHLFASRWPKRYPFFEGYVFLSEIVRATSPTPDGPFRFAEVVLPPRGEQFWDGRMTHNPTIHKIGDKYLLYYIGSTYPGKPPDPGDLIANPKLVDQPYSRIRIGLATASSVRGPWKRLDRPILEPRPGKWDSTIVTNPAACVLPGGEVMLAYRSNTPQGLRLGITKAKSFDRPYQRLSDQPVFTFTDGSHVEDPYLWWENGQCEMLAKDMSGGITGEKHAGVHAMSRDGINWSPAPEPKAYSRNLVWRDGKTQTLGCLERPQLLIEGGHPAYLYCAAADGPGGFRAAKNTWSQAIELRTQPRRSE